VNNGKYKEGMKMRRERDLGKLVELINENYDVLLEFVGIHLTDGKPSRFWAGLDTSNYYLESEDGCYVVNDSEVLSIFSSLISFEELKRRSKEGDEEIKKLVRFEDEEISLVELMIEDEISSLRFVCYFETLNIRLWHLLGSLDVYVEGRKKACRRKYAVKELYQAMEELMKTYLSEDDKEDNDE
jgi:hypothetical protein